MRILISALIALGLSMSASAQPTQAEKAAAKVVEATKVQGNLVPGFSLQELQQILIDAGYRAVLEEDNSGPYIRSGASGLNIFLSLFDCLEDNTECRTIRIESGTFKVDPPLSPEALNEWTRDVVTGWAVPIVSTDGSYYLLMKVSTTGGVTRDWLMQNFEIFADSLGKYHKLLFPS